jgi:hypothetical protein
MMTMHREERKLMHRRGKVMLMHCQIKYNSVSPGLICPWSPEGDMGWITRGNMPQRSMWSLDKYHPVVPTVPVR